MAFWSAFLQKHCEVSLCKGREYVKAYSLYLTIRIWGEEIKKIICIVLCLFLCASTLAGTVQTKAVLIEGTAIAVTLKLLAMAGITIGGVYSLVELAKTINDLVAQIASYQPNIYSWIDTLTQGVDNGHMLLGQTARLIIIDIINTIKGMQDNKQFEFEVGTGEETIENDEQTTSVIYDAGTVTDSRIDYLPIPTDSNAAILCIQGDLNIQILQNNGTIWRFYAISVNDTNCNVYKENLITNTIYTMSTNANKSDSIALQYLNYNGQGYIVIWHKNSFGQWMNWGTGSSLGALLAPAIPVNSVPVERTYTIPITINTTIPLERVKEGWESIPVNDLIDVSIPAFEEGYAQPEGAITDELPQAVVNAIPREGVDIDVGDIIVSIPVDITKDAVLNFTKLKQNWSGIAEVFPFCLPFDFLTMVQSLATIPETPIFSIDFANGPFLGGTLVELDLSEWNGTAQLVRTLVFICFCGFLLFATSKIMRW